MNIISPRTIVGNRGDLLSRFGILDALRRHVGGTPVAFVNEPRDLGPIDAVTLPYGPLYNFWPRWAGVCALRQADTVVWTGGLDLQDDSSLLKLVHTWMTFLSYRLLGKRIIVLGQGAGPLTSSAGYWLTRRIANLVDTFVVRDTGSLKLLLKVGSRTRLVKGHDGIFLDGLTRLAAQPAEMPMLDAMTGRTDGQPLIGVNIRFWFHFAGGLLPYQFVKERHRRRAEAPMQEMIGSTCELVRRLRVERNARVVLISMYDPGTHPWEDDLPHLEKVKQAFPADDDVVLLDAPLSLGGFAELMRRLDLMIGARLHSTLTALRFGVPALNLAYTDKCSDILSDLGLADHLVPLQSFIDDPAAGFRRACAMLDDGPLAGRIRKLVQERVDANERILADLFGGVQATRKQAA